MRRLLLLTILIFSAGCCRDQQRLTHMRLVCGKCKSVVYDGPGEYTRAARGRGPWANRDRVRMGATANLDSWISMVEERIVVAS